MANFTQELRDILPIDNEEKLDALLKLMNRRHTVITTYIDITIFKHLTDSNLRNTYCIKTGRKLSNVLFNIAAIEKKRKKKASQKETDEKKAKAKPEKRPTKETYSPLSVVPLRRPVVPESVYKQGRVSRQRIRHGYAPEGPRLQKNKGVSSLQIDWAKAASIVNSVQAVNKITPEQRAAAETAAMKPNPSSTPKVPTPQKPKTPTPAPLESIYIERNRKSATQSQEPDVPESLVPSQENTRESLYDIVWELDSCAKARRGTGVAPIARVHCLYDGKAQTFWFTNRLYSPRDTASLNGFGRFVPKYSNVAIQMQKSKVGTSFSYNTTNYIKRLETHHVLLENQSDLQNQTIAIAGDALEYQYRNIQEFLTALRKNAEDIRDIESRIAELEQQRKRKNAPTEKAQLTNSIKKCQEEYRILTQQQEDLKNITIYIRKQGEMRYSLIVDPIQTRIMEQNLFDGKTVVINGGPGTGKTTTMIHRLAYLTDTFAIDEDAKDKLGKYKISPLQRKHLKEAIMSQRDWMFFSPSQMLKKYLADAMKKEGLANAADKVWNWRDYCRMVLQDYYHILESKESSAPFKVCLWTDTLFYQDSGIVQMFTNFYLDIFRDIKNQLPPINAGETVYAWTAIASNIKNRLENTEAYDLAHFVSLFNSLESVYYNDCKKILSDRDNAVNALTEEICLLIEENTDVKSEMEELLDLTSVESEEENYEYGAIDVEEEETGEINERQKNIIRPILDRKQSESELSKIVKKWLKSYCLNKVNASKELSATESLITETLLPVVEGTYDEKMLRIGNLMVFEQFAQYTRGVRSIMLKGLPARYKKFREYLNKTQFQGCDQKLLRDIIHRNQGKELHHQEMALLLGFINTLVKQIKASTNAKIKHDYIEAYEEISRPIIGIDEATDFSICEIYAMQSLLTQGFNSLTLCGDLMQRMTPYGIKSWKELEGVIVNPVVVEMKTSYRQSKKLLEVARQLYRDTLNETPNYRAFMKSNKVPAPLVCVDENELNKIEWISKRIQEVHRAYGEQLPSIAIFVTDKGYIPHFIDNLESTEFFKEKRIKILDGTNANNIPENHICVYPIDVVKGMEFDVVFFHNIDKSDANKDLLRRYIYVGVSRAAFFLGITMNEEDRDICRYFEKKKDWFII